ncbi:MAG: hypothetical protein AAFR61_15115 [Bacteroidota bacterium]
MMKLLLTYRKEIITVSIGLAVLIVLAYMLKSLFQKKDTERTASKISTQARTRNLDPERVVSDAVGLKNAFGIDWGWWGLDAWTEDEAAAVAIILDYDRSTFPILADAYYELSEQTRNLKSDLYSFLSEDDLQPILHIIS